MKEEDRELRRAEGAEEWRGGWKKSAGTGRGNEGRPEKEVWVGG